MARDFWKLSTALATSPPNIFGAISIGRGSGLLGEAIQTLLASYYARNTRSYQVKKRIPGSKLHSAVPRDFSIADAFFSCREVAQGFRFGLRAARR
jgi:hypothetical protein